MCLPGDLEGRPVGSEKTFMVFPGFFITPKEATNERS
jgi:hypothetical protein